MVIKMVLNKRIYRDLKNSFFRYLAVFCVVAIAMYVVVGMAGAAETVMTGVSRHAEKNMVQDGQFTLFVNLSQEERNEMENVGVILEEHFNMDFSVNDSVLRVFKTREFIDLFELDNGAMPSSDDEIVLEKHYYEANSISIGDVMYVGGLEFSVVGYGSTPDYDDVLQSLADASSDPTRFGTAFVTDGAYQKLKESENAQAAEEKLYAYRLGNEISQEEFVDQLQTLVFDINEVSDQYALEYFQKAEDIKADFSEGISDLVDGSKEVTDACEEMNQGIIDFSNVINTNITVFGLLQGAADELVEGSDKVLDAATELKDGADRLNESYLSFADEYLTFEYKNLKQHVTNEDNPRINASANDIQINKNGAMIAGAIVLMLLAYVLSAFATNSIESERRIIGTLYSMGFVKHELLRNYVTLPVVVSTLGGIVGTIIGFANMDSQVADNSVYFSYPILENIYPTYLIIYGIVVPFLMSLIINALLINKKLSVEPLALMNKQQKQFSGKEINLGNLKFVNRFRIRLFIRELRSNVTIVAGVFSSLLLVMLALTIYSATTTIIDEIDRDVHFEYMYYLTYPEDDAPQNAEMAYHKTLTRERLGYNFDVSILGIDNDSIAFPYDIETMDDEVFISTSVAEKYDIQVGDELGLTDKLDNITYNFKVKEIVNFASGLFVFMDIDSMRERFEKEDDYYNVLISNEELDIDNGRIYSVITGTNLRYASDIFWSLMKKLVYLLVVASILLFVLVMYLMVKMIIERQTNNISVLKLFGYTKAEVSKLYLRNNTYIVLLSSIVFIPLTKWIIVQIYPYLTQNRAVGFNLDFSKELYCFLVGVIAVSYIISYLLSVLRLNKVDVQEVLKERE